MCLIRTFSTAIANESSLNSLVVDSSFSCLKVTKKWYNFWKLKKLIDHFCGTYKFLHWNCFKKPAKVYHFPLEMYSNLLPVFVRITKNFFKYQQLVRFWLNWKQTFTQHFHANLPLVVDKWRSLLAIRLLSRTFFSHAFCLSVLHTKTK